MVQLLFALSTAHAQAIPFSGGTQTRDFHYRWSNSSTGEVVESNAAFTFVPTAQQTGTDCNAAHAAPYCWTGTFTTDDFGNGTVTSVAVPGSAATRSQRLTFTYAGTGAVYTGTVRYRNTTERFTGTLALPGNVAWSGIFDQNLVLGLARSFAADEELIETGDTGFAAEEEDTHPGRGRGRPGWSGGPGSRND